MKYDPIRVGHIHDEFCRCRTCKPPLVGERKLPVSAAIFIILSLTAALWAAIILLSF